MTFLQTCGRYLRVCLVILSDGVWFVEMFAIRVCRRSKTGWWRSVLHEYACSCDGAFCEEAQMQMLLYWLLISVLRMIFILLRRFTWNRWDELLPLEAAYKMCWCPFMMGPQTSFLNQIYTVSKRRIYTFFYDNIRRLCWMLHLDLKHSTSVLLWKLDRFCWCITLMQ